MQEKPCFFYFSSCSDGSLYAGTAVDLKEREGRYDESRGGKYAHTRLPANICSEAFASVSDARKREASVKTWPKEPKESTVCRGASRAGWQSVAALI